MSVYRTRAHVPAEPLEEQPDPFPAVSCFDCGARTTSMNGEDLCAACDLKWLKRGIDWAALNCRLVSLGAGTKVLSMDCAYCGLPRFWPQGFPNRHHAECTACARVRFRHDERLRVVVFIARLGAFVRDLFDEMGRPSRPGPLP
jgi:hypothetical protein